jgi:hypothetical protein
MTGPEHYREAERLIEKAVHLSPAVDGADPELTALAQVHATLALAAATALHTAGVYLTLGTSESWRAAIGAESIKDEAGIVE